MRPHHLVDTVLRCNWVVSFNQFPQHQRDPGDESSRGAFLNQNFFLPSPFCFSEQSSGIAAALRSSFGFFPGSDPIPWQGSTEPNPNPPCPSRSSLRSQLRNRCKWLNDETC